MADTKMVEGESIAKGTKTSQKKETIPSIEFSLLAPDAKEVILVGTFNDWNVPGGFKMRKFKEGIWKKRMNLRPGRYEYQFVVDSAWWTDPKNSTKVGNVFGTENSVLEV